MPELSLDFTRVFYQIKNWGKSASDPRDKKTGIIIPKELLGLLIFSQNSWIKIPRVSSFDFGIIPKSL